MLKMNHYFFYILNCIERIRNIYLPVNLFVMRISRKDTREETLMCALHALLEIGTIKFQTLEEVKG